MTDEMHCYLRQCIAFTTKLRLALNPTYCTQCFTLSHKLLQGKGPLVQHVRFVFDFKKKRLFDVAC